MNQRDREVVSASEIAAYAWCPESWRLESGLGVEPENGGRVASDQEQAISRPVCWTATGLMVSLEEWEPTTSSVSGFAANSRSQLGSASPPNAWSRPSASGSVPALM